MAVINIREAADQEEALELRQKLEVASRALQKRSSDLGKRKHKIDEELRQLRSSFSDGTVSILSKTDYY